MNRFIAGYLVFAVAALGTPARAAKMSLVVVVDGMGFGTNGFGVANTPNMNSLINGTFSPSYHGAYADNAFAGGVLGTATQQPTVSGPGWSTILTGVWTDRHLVTDNSFNPRDYVNNPPYFKTLEATIPNIYSASVVNWAPVNDYIIASVDQTGTSMNYRTSTSNDANATTIAVAQLQGLDTNLPAAVFVGFDDVDAAGHSSGSSSINYRNAIQTADARIGQMLTAIKNRPNFANEDWLFIVTADHGHLAGGGHGGQSTIERTIPLIVAGKNVLQGDILPIPSAVSHADVAPTVLDFYGVPIPNYYFGDPRGALVGVPGDLNNDTFVNIQDWSVFKNEIGSNLAGLTPLDAYRKGDLNVDGVHSPTDFLLFKQLYVAAGGAAADLAFGVPEPSTVLLLIVATITGLLAKRRCSARARGIVLSFFLAGLLPSLEAQATVLMWENFNSLPLGPNVEESTSGSAVWTSTPPAGWTVDRTGVPGYNNAAGNNGVKEWIGWNFANRDWWVQTAADQGRSGFTRASGAVMVADPDEWDDATHPSGTYNTFISSKSISLAGVPENAAMLTFDSSWMPEGNQTGTLRVSYNGGAPVTVFNWLSSPTSSPDYKPSATNEAVVVSLNNPAGASNMVLTWGLTNAGNNWFWAVDNVAAYYGANPRLPSIIVYTNTGEMALTGGLSSHSIDSFHIASADGSLDTTYWEQTNLHARGIDAVADTSGATPGAGNDPGETWESLVASSTELWDAFLLSSSAFDINRIVSIGWGYNYTLDARDLSVEFTTSDGQTLAGSVTYAVKAPNADQSNNGTVNIFDINIVSDNWGTTGPRGRPGDANLDGLVDIFDVNLMSDSWGAVGSTTAVPEPSTWGLLLAVTCALSVPRLPRSIAFIARGRRC